MSTCASTSSSAASRSARRSGSTSSVSLLFLVPFCIAVIDLVWPLVVQAYHSGEMSSQRRRPDPLAGVRAGADRLRAAAAAGHLRADQAHRLPAGPDRRSRRRSSTRSRPRKSWPSSLPPAAAEPRDDEVMEFLRPTWPRSCSPALIVFLLIGFPVAFSLAACGLFFGFIGIELGAAAGGADAGAAAAHLRHHAATTRCWRSRSSPSWA